MRIGSSTTLAIVLAGALGLAGCSGEPGSASPTTAPANTTTGPTTPGPADAPTASLDPCELLDIATLDREFAEYRPFQEDDRNVPGGRSIAGARACDWETDLDRATNLRQAMGISIGVRDDLGVKDARDAGGGVNRGKLASGREAAQMPSPPEGCIMALAVGESSRVDVVIDAPKQACGIAEAIADLIEPKLPDA